MDKALVDYVWQSLSKGYSAEAVRAQLAAQRYSPQDIEEVFAYVQANKNVVVEKHSSLASYAPFVLIGLAVFVLLVGLGSAFFLFDTPQPTVERQEVTFVPLETVETSEVIETFEENDPVEEVEQQIIPESESSQANEALPVEQEPIIQDFAVLLSPRIEIENQVESIAEQYPDEAAALCENIESQSGQDSCHMRVALLSSTPERCAAVSIDAVRDNCILQFPLEGIGSAENCDGISQSLLRSQCRKLYSAFGVVEPVEITKYS